MNRAIYEFGFINYKKLKKSKEHVGMKDMKAEIMKRNKQKHRFRCW